MVMVDVSDLEQPNTLVMVKVTFLLPDVAYSIPAGFSADELAGEATEPKFHINTYPVLLSPVLVKSTDSPWQAGAVEVKDTAGCGLMVITLVVLENATHKELIISSVTVFAPEVEYTIPAGL